MTVCPGGTAEDDSKTLGMYSLQRQLNLKQKQLRRRIKSVKDELTRLTLGVPADCRPETSQSQSTGNSGARSNSGRRMSCPPSMTDFGAKLRKGYLGLGPSSNPEDQLPFSLPQEQARVIRDLAASLRSVTLKQGENLDSVGNRSFAKEGSQVEETGQGKGKDRLGKVEEEPEVGPVEPPPPVVANAGQGKKKEVEPDREERMRELERAVRRKENANKWCRCPRG